MKRRFALPLGFALVVSAAAGCSSTPETPDPSPFCNTVFAFQEASIAAANAAIQGGDAGTPALRDDIENVIVPLERIQSTLPSDAPDDVRQAVATYLRGLQERSTVAAATQDEPAPVDDAATDAPDESVASEAEPAATNESKNLVSDAELQTSAKVLEGYVDEECPHTVPTEGSPTARS